MSSNVLRVGVNTHFVTTHEYCNLIGAARFLAASTSLGIEVNLDLSPQVAEAEVRLHPTSSTTWVL